MPLTQLPLLIGIALAPIQSLPQPPDSAVLSAPAPATDTLLESARGALGRGRPWQASRLIAPVVRDSTLRTPSAVILAATAASRWGGWPEVGRLLEGEAWLDSLFEGRGRILLARSALERGADSAALAHVLRRPGAGIRVRGRALLPARVRARPAGRPRQCRRELQARRRGPAAVSDWLLLRAAAATGDSAARAAIFDRIVMALPRERIRWTEAVAHERTGDLDGASRRSRAIGSRLSALRLRIAMPPDSAHRAAVRRELLELVTAGGAGAEIRGAIGLLDSVFAPLTVEEELLVARAADDAGLAARAVAGYPKALSAGLGGQTERYGYASALARIGRHADAAAQFKLVQPPGWMAASAAYLRARSLVRDGQVVQGRAALVEIPAGFPATPRPRPRPSSCSAISPRTTRPTGWPGPTIAGPPCAIRPAVSRRPPASARPWSSYSPATRRWPAASSTSWPAVFPERRGCGIGVLGRASLLPRGRQCEGARPLAEGDSGRSDILLRQPRRPAARSAGVGAPRALDCFVPVPAMDSAVARASLLARLGMTAESRWEYDRLARASRRASERMLAVANALRSQGLASQAIQLARSALAKGAPADARTYRLCIRWDSATRCWRRRRSIGSIPSFVAALIRQESMFNPAATSPAGRPRPDAGDARPGRQARGLARLSGVGSRCSSTSRM